MKKYLQHEKQKKSLSSKLGAVISWGICCNAYFLPLKMDSFSKVPNSLCKFPLNSVLQRNYNKYIIHIFPELRNNEIEKLKRHIDALNTHTGKDILGESWVQTLLTILKNPERENNLLKEERRDHLESLFVGYRLQKIAAAHPSLAKEIFLDALLKNKLLHDEKLNSNTLEKIAKSHPGSAEFIFERMDLREMLLQGKSVSLPEFLERGTVDESISMLSP